MSDDNEADFSEEEESLTAEESLATAREHEADGNTEEALLCYGHALQMVVEAAGDETAAECAPYYYAYGDALMTAGDRTARELGDAEEEEEDGPAAGVVRPTSPGGRERPEDDIELAWEMLEGARVCYDKHPDTAERCVLLADVHSRLGDVMQANEMFAQAITEYTRAHRLREQALDGDGVPTDSAAADAAAPRRTRGSLRRAIAAELCNIGRALQWSVPPRTADAVTHYERAHALVEGLRRENSPEQDEAELFELSEGIASKITELGGIAPSSAPARKRKADELIRGGQVAALPPPGMRGSSGAVCYAGNGGLSVYARWLGGRSSGGYVLAEKARLTVLLPTGVGGAIAPCRGRVDRWGWAAAREFDSTKCSACVDWDDGFDEEEEEEEEEEAPDQSGDVAEQPRRYIAVRNGGGAAVRQIVFEIADPDNADESEHVWPTLLRLDAPGQACAGNLPEAELYSNDLCRLSVLELNRDSGAVQLRFDTPGEAGLNESFRSLQSVKLSMT